MRYLTVLVQPSEGAFHPLAEQLREASSITREAIHQVELLADGTVLLFAEGRGGKDRYRELMASSPYVIDSMVAGEERWLSVDQFEPTGMTRQILELHGSSDLVIETPIRINDDGSLRVTYLGSDSELQTLFRTVGDEVPVEFEVVETGEYEPGQDSFARLLTSRQQEVLQTAVELGYYSAPRQATHDDVAGALDIAPATAGEHLRKIEAQVLGSLAR